jgi:hypothetical protein
MAKLRQADGPLTRRREKKTQGKLLSATTAPNGITSLKDQGRKTLQRDPDCGRQTVGTRSHNHGIIFVQSFHVWSSSFERPRGDPSKYLRFWLDHRSRLVERDNESL